MRKNFFLYSQIYRDQKIGGKKREIIFPETQQIVRAKNVRKKSSEKGAKKHFLKSHEYRDLKWGEKPAKQFFQKQTNSASKKMLG